MPPPPLHPAAIHDPAVFRVVLVSRVSTAAHAQYCTKPAAALGRTFPSTTLHSAHRPHSMPPCPLLLESAGRGCQEASTLPTAGGRGWGPGPGSTGGPASKSCMVLASTESPAATEKALWTSSDCFFYQDDDILRHCKPTVKPYPRNKHQAWGLALHRGSKLSTPGPYRKMRCGYQHLCD